MTITHNESILMEMEAIITHKNKSRSDRIESKVKKVFKVLVTQHENGSWEVEECHQLFTELKSYKISRQGKWRKVDKRKFVTKTMNNIDYYRTR